MSRNLRVRVGCLLDGRPWVSHHPSLAPHFLGKEKGYKEAVVGFGQCTVWSVAVFHLNQYRHYKMGTFGISSWACDPYGWLTG